MTVTRRAFLAAGTLLGVQVPPLENEEMSPGTVSVDRYRSWSCRYHSETIAQGFESKPPICPLCLDELHRSQVGPMEPVEEA